MKQYVLLLLFVPLISYSQEQTIGWEDVDALYWENFLGTPDTSSPYQALTTWGISYSLNVDKNGNQVISAYSYFDKTRSWVKDGHRTDKLLHHERQHFNIAELYTRKFLKAANELAKKNALNKESIEKLYRQIMKDCIEYHEAYDESTNHGLNPETQKWYDLQIHTGLRKHKKFSNN